MIFSVLYILIRIFLAVALLTIPAIVILYKVWFSYWKKRNVYTWTPTIPFGNAKDVILQKTPFGIDIVDFYNDLKNKSLKYGGYYLFLTPVFVPVDIDLIKKIFVSDFDYFCDRVSYVDEENDPISTNLVHLHRERWKIIRPIIRQFISTKNLNAGFPLLTQKVDSLVDLIKDTMNKENSVDIKDVLDRFGIDVIGAFFLQIDCNTMITSNTVFKNKVTNFFNSSVKDSLIRLIISLPTVVKFFKVKTYNSEVTEFFTEFIENILESRKNREVPQDVLNALISNQVPITKSEVIGNIASLFLGGYDTTSNSTSFCLYELALNKKIQDAVRVEVNSVFEKHSGKCTYSTLNDLVFLDKCIKETLRKYPLTHIVSRMCIKDYSIPDSDLVLSKGTHLYMPMRAIHWDPEFYPNPEKFDPERFSKPPDKNRHPCAWIPFGIGPRHCVGQKLGSILMKLSLAIMLKNYEFSIHPSTEFPIRYDPKTYILQSEKPIRLIAKNV